MAPNALDSDSEGDVKALLPDLPRGPLEAYRARASFCWKEMVLFLEGEDVLRLKVRLGGCKAGGQRDAPWPPWIQAGKSGTRGTVWLGEVAEAALGPAQACF